jgi:hypothetical protein
MNYPRNYAGTTFSRRLEKPDWLRQYVAVDGDDEVWKPGDQAESDKFPLSGWMSELLTRESLSICALSSESVVAETMAQIEVTSAPP